MFHGKRGRTPLIGPVGGLIQLHGSSSVDVTRAARVTKSVALSGRVTSQQGPPPRREWSVAVSSAHPEHFQALQQLESGLFGAGPFAFYDEYAQVTNMLSPAQSTLGSSSWSGGSPGGAGTAADGTRYLRSRVSGVGEVVSLTVPLSVPAQFPVTVSAYVSTHPANSATVRIYEIDPEGAVVGSPHASFVLANQHAFRSSVSFVTSVRTVSLRIEYGGALVVTLPAVTLTGKAAPWAYGAGCPGVVFDLSGHAVLKAVDHPSGRRASYSMTVHELG